MRDVTDPARAPPELYHSNTFCKQNSHFRCAFLCTSLVAVHVYLLFLTSYKMHQTESFEADEAEPAPSVESDDPEERIKARRLRIAERNEAKKGRKLGEVLQRKETMKEEQRESQKEVEISERHMEKLKTDGLELVTNILVATDARESKRRTDEEEANRLRREKLENEARSSQEKYEEITHKWTEAKMKQTPLDLRDALNSQQQLCNQITDDKNKLINDLKQELKASDDRYVKDLRKEAKDTDLLIERMEEQISSLKKSYREKLHQIENSFGDERRTLLAKNRKKWEQQMKERCDKELKNMMHSLSLMEEHEDLLHKLRTQTAEEYNTDKIKLDTEVQNSRMKVQEMKFNCHLNQEKLDDKFTTLKKREEENSILKSQLKRKLIRTQDAVNNLKSKCSEQEKESKLENQSLSKDYTRLNQQYKDMQKKARHFAALDMERYEKVWLMNEAEVKNLAHRALEVDRLIHEQQLGLAWDSPPLDFMKRSGPIRSIQQDFRTAGQAAADALKEEQEEESSDIVEGSENTAGGVNRRIVKNILELLCDETGFLIDSKLQTLLSCLEKSERSLVKLDAVFSAMGIESEEDVYRMTEFFMKYKQLGREQRDHEAEAEATDLIDPKEILLALKDFTAQNCRPCGVWDSQHSSVLELNMRDDYEDAAYWESLANVIPESKLKLWAALDTALNEYHTVLTERAELLVETQSVKQQNTELRNLLHQYTTSKANSELDIHPTR
ncbi:dynein regulatory complex protein 1 [Triplophysa dalaica]|uniref:dynein regulatory complex protein 1 n=1 Tax=Triplophysa dalaica TaxID=1582913 RepID=UPI0024DF4C5E|nr:dynein regulatory complex protein 1 [Triplophysa dalaica]